MLISPCDVFIGFHISFKRWKNIFTRDLPFSRYSQSVEPHTSSSWARVADKIALTRGVTKYDCHQAKSHCGVQRGRFDRSRLPEKRTWKLHTLKHAFSDIRTLSPPPPPPASVTSQIDNGHDLPAGLENVYTFQVLGLQGVFFKSQVQNCVAKDLSDRILWSENGQELKMWAVHSKILKSTTVPLFGVVVFRLPRLLVAYFNTIFTYLAYFILELRSLSLCIENVNQMLLGIEEMGYSQWKVILLILVNLLKLVIFQPFCLIWSANLLNRHHQ